MVQFLFTNKDMESLKGLYRIMANGFVSVSARFPPLYLIYHEANFETLSVSAGLTPVLLLH